MAEQTKNTAAAKQDDRVELYIPKGSAHDEPNLFIGINGVSYLLPKGKTSLVPKAVAAEYYRSMKAANRQDENIDKLLSKQ